MQKKNVNKNGKWCILTVFETIWNCRVKMKTWTVNGAFWRYLKCREKIENKDAYACILTVFETLFETAMRKKYMFWLNQSWSEVLKNKEAKWCILTLFWDLSSTTFRHRASPLDQLVLPPPHPLQFLLQIWTFYFSHFWTWRVGPGLLGL